MHHPSIKKSLTQYSTTHGQHSHTTIEKAPTFLSAAQSLTTDCVAMTVSKLEYIAQ